MWWWVLYKICSQILFFEELLKCMLSFRVGNSASMWRITSLSCLFKPQVKEIVPYFVLCVINKPFIRNSFFLFYRNNSNENTTLQVSSFPLFILTGYYSPALVFSFPLFVTGIQRGGALIWYCLVFLWI